MRPFLAALVCLTLASCGDANPAAGVVDEERFVGAYARLLILSANPGSGQAETPEQVLKDAGMTREEFRRRVAEYNRDPQRWGPFIEKVQKIVEAEAIRQAPPTPGRDAEAAPQGISSSASTPSDSVSGAQKGSPARR